MSPNIRKLCKVLNNITEDDLYAFAIDNEIPLESVIKAYDYVKLIPQANMKKKIIKQKRKNIANLIMR